MALSKQVRKGMMLSEPVASIADKEDRLKRSFGFSTMLGFTFSITGLAPSISSLLMYSFPGSGVGLTWGWFAPTIMEISVFITLSELVSAMPSAAGPYWWTYKLAPLRWKRFLSFFCGYASTLGLLAGIGACNYGASEQLLACVRLSTGYESSNAIAYGVYAALILIELVLVCLPRIAVTIIEVFTGILNLTVIFLVCIALPVGMKHGGKDLNSGSFVFGDTTNYTNYPYGMTYMMCWGTCIWTIGGITSPIYLVEESKRPSRDLPLVMLINLGLSGALGFVILSLIAACMDASMDSVQTLMASNLPLASIIERALNTGWATAIMSMFAFLQFSMGYGCLTAYSRQVFAFARDGALPFSGWLKRTSLKQQLPIPALIFSATIPLLVGLLIFAGPVAANAIFALNCASVFLSYTIPVVCYLLRPEGLESPGWFYIGKRWSKPVAWVAFAFLLWIVFVDNMLPANVPVTDPSEMNYTCLVCGAVWLGAILYWLVSARKWYNGPQGTLAEIENAEVLDMKSTDSLEAVDEDTKIPPHKID